jgi:integrase
MRYGDNRAREAAELQDVRGSPLPRLQKLLGHATPAMTSAMPGRRRRRTSRKPFARQ